MQFFFFENEYEIRNSKIQNSILSKITEQTISNFFSISKTPLQKLIIRNRIDCFYVKLKCYWIFKYVDET